MISIFIKPALRYLRMAGITVEVTLTTGICPCVLYADDYAIIALELENNMSGGEGLNLFGQVVGVVDGEQAMEPFVWIPDRFHMLGSGDGIAASATDVSDTGIVVGYYDVEDWRGVPFAWTRRSKGMIPLPFLVGFNDGQANAVNNAGVIVGINRQYGVGESRAVQWVNGVISELPNFGMWGGEAKDINEAGWIVGWLIDENHYWQPVLWQDGNVTELGALFEYGPNGEATGVNEVGQITGFSDTRGGDHAFLWQDGEMVDIHNPLNYNWVTSLAWAINNETQVVGVLVKSNGWDDTAFVWSPDRGMEELVSFLPPNSHWTNLNQAKDINDLGQMVGYGHRDDTSPWEHGFLMTPVHPAFTLDQPLPGIAGEVNMVTVRNLTPGTQVYIVYGTVGGGTIIPTCEIIKAALQIEDPLTAGIAVANKNGVARLTGKVPGKWSGQEILFQALVVDTCEISNLIVQKFD